MTTVFHNGRFFVSPPVVTEDSQASFASCMAIADGRITHIGSLSDSPIQTLLQSSSTTQIDLQRRIILPGLIDSHMHLLVFGQGLHKLDLTPCNDLTELRASIKAYAAANSNQARIYCKGWTRYMSNGVGLASDIDDLDPRPIFIDAKDLHSTWCNSAALEEMGAASAPDPDGGEILRDEQGKPTGELKEGAVMLFVWPHIARVASLAEKQKYLRAAFSAYLAAGYTGVVDMAMDENAWSVLQTLRESGPLPLRVSAYWLVTPSSSSEANMLSQVDRAASLAAQHNTPSSPKYSPDCRLVGIKLICDGIIDACTAALTEPYTHTLLSPEPIWSPAQLHPVVTRAHASGLQIALHAIGSLAIRNAVSALSTLSPGRRHRIEHLELASPSDALRLGELGITASIQPVHADPAILRAWPSLLGEKRAAGAFAYKDFLQAGATLALGTDAPTAPFAPFANLYTACTRRSAREVESREMVGPEQRLGLASAVAAYTAGAAYSVFAEGETGALEVGKSADFVVADVAWSEEGVLGGRVRETWVRGEKVFDAEV